MAVKLVSSRDASRGNGIKIAVYGRAGAGKTSLVRSIKDQSPLILSCEAGLLPLRDLELATIEIRGWADMLEALDFVRSPDADIFKWVILDSFSEMMSVKLNEELKSNSDPRRAYGNLAADGAHLARAFRDIPKNILFLCKSEQIQDGETGAVLYGPSLPGKQLATDMPYWFDELLALQVKTQHADDGTQKTYRWLQTQPDSRYDAKDRSGVLDPRGEPADLAAVASKILTGGNSSE